MKTQIFRHPAIAEAARQTIWPQPSEDSGAAVAGDGSGSLSGAGGRGGEDD